MPGIFIYPNDGARYLAGQIRTDLAAVQIMLFKNDVLPGPGTLFGDLQECDFTGYERYDPAVWGAVFLDPVLGGASFQTNYQWNYTGDGVTGTNTVYGFALLQVEDDCFAIGTFDAPIVMAAPGDAIPLTVKLNFGR